MKISVCKWNSGATSPILFFIDDFANVWVDVNGNGKIDLEEDWGYAKDEENSSFLFLKNEILKEFSKVKVTFFVPVGIRVGITENPSIKSISKMINCDEETKAFFKSINDNERYEIAYHGTSHGRVGKTNNDFKQEWELFNSLNEAVKSINKGKEIYKDVFNCYPRGGKYCGYESNEFSDESINEIGFMWWCRYYNRGLIDYKNCSIGGGDVNQLTNLDVKTFGSNEVLDIPTTLSGGLLTGVLNPNKKTLKGMLKVILKKHLIKRKLKQIDFLLKNNLVVSIHEHISPARDDGRRQTPNIFDDEESLKYIFNYLKGKNAWYCTGTELAKYYFTREKINISPISENEFEILNAEELKGERISIKVDEKYSKIMDPDLIIINKKNNVFNLVIKKGVYKLF